MRIQVKFIVFMIGALSLVSLIVPAASAQPAPTQTVVLDMWVPNYPPEQEILRIFTADLKKLGIELNVKSSNYDEWTANIVGGENPYHLAMCTWGSSPDRLDPDFFLTEFFHSSRAVPKSRNYGRYVNPEYDRLVDGQRREMNPEKRRELVRKAQELIDRDNAFINIYFKAYFQAYNSDRIDGAIPVMGSGIGFPYIPLTYLYAKPKTNRREITVVNIHDIISLNPFFIPDIENEWWLRLIYDPLIRRDKELKLIPWAARAWKVVDGTNIDITLRDGMKFHDNVPVTAEDLKFTIDYIREWKFPVLSRIWKNVEQASILDKSTVRLKLTEPYAPFIETVLTYMFVAPKHIWEKIPRTVDVKNPVDWPNPSPIGSGAYKFDVWKKGEYFHLVANKEHFNAPQFDGIYYRVNPTTEGIMAMMEKGEADVVAWNLDAEQAKRLSSFPHLKTIQTPSIAMTEIRPHFKKSPTDDPAFRQALQHATHRKLMLDITYGGNGVLGVNTPIIPTISYWNNPKVGVPEYNIEKAKSILQKAGYTWDGSGRLCYPKK